MKILYIHTGRLEEKKANFVQAFQMCSAFAQSGQEVLLAINSYTLNNKQAEKKLCDEMKLPSLPFKLLIYKGRHYLGKLKSIGAALAIKRLLKSTEYDIAFIRDPVLLPLVAGNCSNIIFEAHNNLTFPPGGIIDSAWRRMIVSHARKPRLKLFITISKTLRKYWENAGVPSNKLCALHDAVNPNIFCVDTSKNDARKKVSLPIDKKIVLYAGSLHKDRSIPEILKLAEGRPDINFVIVGGPEKARQNFKNIADNSGRKNIILTGRVPHHIIPLYLAAADVLLMLWSREVPTINYCSPLKMFEYMASERIIVGHSFPTIAEVLEHGKHAYLVNPDSFQELTDQLNNALDKPNPEMAKAAQKLVIEKYTWTQRCQSIIKSLTL
ncbi:glycosyltransferase [Verrucomicrobiota bacterium]